MNKKIFYIIILFTLMLVIPKNQLHAMETKKYEKNNGHLYINVAEIVDIDPNEGKILETTCEDLLTTNAKKAIQLGIIAIRIIAPVLLFVLSLKEFLQAIASQKDDAVQTAWKKFGVRAGVTVAIMLIPTFLNIIFRLTGQFDNCGIW